MSNVVKFPETRRSSPLREVDLQKVRAAMPSNAAFKTLLRWLVVLVRVAVFLVLYWLRLPVMLICRPVSVLCLFAWLFAWYAFPEKTAMVWGFAAFSLVAFVVMSLYDVVLML